MTSKEHYTTKTKAQGALISTSAWVKDDVEVVSLLHFELRGVEATSEMNIWISSEETKTLIQALHQHLENIKTCELHILAHAEKEQIAA